MRMISEKFCVFFLDAFSDLAYHIRSASEKSAFFISVRQTLLKASRSEDQKKQNKITTGLHGRLLLRACFCMRMISEKFCVFFLDAFSVLTYHIRPASEKSAFFISVRLKALRSDNSEKLSAAA